MNKLNLLILFIALVLGCSSAQAQDVLTLKTGEEIKAKIQEVGVSDIKYKKFDNLNGPTYAIMKAEVFMIKYENGTKDVFGNTSPAAKPDQSNNEYNSNQDYAVRKQVEEGIKTHEAQADYDKNMKLYKSKLVKGIVLTSIGVPMMCVGAGLTGYAVTLLQTNVYGTDNTLTWLPLIITGPILLGVGIPLSIVGPVTLGRSFHYRGLARRSKASMSFEPLLSPASGNRNFAGGMGMKIRF